MSRRKLKTGVKMLSETIRADLREGDIGTELGEVAKRIPDVDDRLLSVLRREARPNTNVVVRSRDADKLAAAQSRVEAMLEKVRTSLAAQGA